MDQMAAMMGDGGGGEPPLIAALRRMAMEQQRALRDPLAPKDYSPALLGQALRSMPQKAQPKPYEVMPIPIQPQMEPPVPEDVSMTEAMRRLRYYLGRE